MATKKILISDGTQTETLYQLKAINPWTDETPGVWSGGKNADAEALARSNRLVPSVFAGIQARMQAMADLPFSIYSLKGDKEIDNSDDYRNAIGFLPYPAQFLALAEGAFVTSGRNYWFKVGGAKSGAIKSLRYWLPDSVKLNAEAAKKNDIIFERTGATTKFTPKEVLYAWLVDPSVELGPPTVWPLKSAMISAEAAGAITAWARDYMNRGAIKAMLLMVEGAPSETDAEAIQTWFNKFMSGVRGLTWRIFNAEGIKPTVIGDGLEALKDLSITKELRYDIHTALGTRHLLEDENFATANARRQEFYENTIVPDARTLQQMLNEQILHAAGLHWEFEPERLEVFQEDEAQRAGALGTLFATFSAALAPGQALELSLGILGYDFDEEQKKIIAQGLADKQAERDRVAQQMADAQNKPPASGDTSTTSGNAIEGPQAGSSPRQQGRSINARALVELDKWEKKIKKAGKMVTWHAVALPDQMVMAITNGELSFAAARRAIKWGDDIRDDEPIEPASDLKVLAEAINNLAAGYVSIAPAVLADKSTAFDEDKPA